MRDTAPAVGTDCLAHTADLHSFPSRRKFKKKEEKTLYIYTCLRCYNKKNIHV